MATNANMAATIAAMFTGLKSTLVALVRNRFRSERVGRETLDFLVDQVPGQTQDCGHYDRDGDVDAQAQPEAGGGVVAEVDQGGDGSMVPTSAMAAPP